LASIFVLLRNIFPAASDQLHAVVGGQPFLEWLRKLLRELGPAFLPNLVLETVQDFTKHILQVRLWIEPAGNGVTEEDEIGDDSGRVDTDHLTHPAEGRVLLVVVPNVPETGTPRPDKLLKTGGNNAWAHQTHPSDCDRRVLQQSFWGVWPVDDGDERVEDVGDVAGHVVAQLHGDLPCRPGGVVAHADVLRIQVAGQDRHELWYARVNMGKASLGEVAQQCKAGLTNLRH